MVDLVVNGDDFGLSEEVNEGIFCAFKEGILTSCSLMTTGGAFDQAVRLAKENAGLAVGIHLVTVMGQSVLPHSEIPTIVDCDRNFSSDPALAGLKYFFSTRARRELRKELEAQFNKFRETGLKLSHIDSHLHMHVHPVVFDAAVKLGEQYGVKRMRVPEDDLGLAMRYDGDRSLHRIIYALTFWLLSKRMKKRLGMSGFSFTDRVYGNLLTGRMQKEYVLYMLENIRGGSAEIYFHPAMYSDGSVLGNEEFRRAGEAEILLSREIMNRIKMLGIRLINYSELKVSR
ncbi:MAG: hopanoid biosynthesis-associated protein HpnK [Syntrophobacteraceae bacterium]